MNFTITDNNVMKMLEDIQDEIQVSENISNHTYMCDCSACSNECYSECTDGPGVMG